jgi:hypothetical protein
MGPSTQQPFSSSYVIATTSFGHTTMPPDDGHMTETCCDNNIGKGEELLC